MLCIKGKDSAFVILIQGHMFVGTPLPTLMSAKNRLAVPKRLSTAWEPRSEPSTESRKPDGPQRESVIGKIFYFTRYSFSETVWLFTFSIRIWGWQHSGMMNSATCYHLHWLHMKMNIASVSLLEMKNSSMQFVVMFPMDTHSRDSQFNSFTAMLTEHFQVASGKCNFG